MDAGLTSPDHRSSQLSKEAEALYMTALETPEVLTEPIDPMLRPSVKQLLRLGLLEQGAEGAFRLADPSRLEAAWVADLHGSAMSLLSQAARVPNSLSDLKDVFRGGPPPEAQHATELLDGAAAERRISELVAACSKEIFGVHLGKLQVVSDGTETGFFAGAQQALFRADLDRRVLLQSSTRYDLATRESVASISASGAEVRALEEPGPAVLILDRQVAVQPVYGDALALCREPAIVGYMAGCVERAWARADLYGEASSATEYSARTQDAIQRLLVEGYGQQEIADRMFLSSRTVATHISRLRQRHGADTLFQLGRILGQASAPSGHDSVAGGWRAQ